MSERKSRPGRYSDEVRERAVRMLFEHQHEHPTQWKAIESISKKLNINHETLRQWVRRAEADAGTRPGLTTDERARMGGDRSARTGNAFSAGGVMGADVTVRATREADRRDVLALVRTTFSGPDRDGEEEVSIVWATWALGQSVRPIDLVALYDEVIVGHVLGAEGNLSGVLAVAPLAVAPACQRQGVGSLLMDELLKHGAAGGWTMAVLLGNPQYYGRFGFLPASRYGLNYLPVGAGDPHFMARPLQPHAECSGGDFQYCWER